MLLKIAALANNVAETINAPEIALNSPVNSRPKMMSFNKLLILKIQKVIAMWLA
jgi:hypothetical protein